MLQAYKDEARKLVAALILLESVDPEFLKLVDIGVWHDRNLNPDTSFLTYEKLERQAGQ